MSSSLEHLVDEGVLGEILARLKSGKEADVYMVRYGGKVVAAKVYKDREQRSFKNRSAYKEGRSVRSSRSQRAIDKGSKYGRAADEDAWKTTEVTTLYKLHAAGVRVPTPVLFLEGVLLMEVVRGADGDIAPRLIDMDLTVEEARAAYFDMLSQLARILSCDLIHGDLSPYNVLWSTNGPTIIDFPQAISAAHNTSSERFFLRDARNILDHLVAADPALRARSGDAHEIWRAYVRRELTPDFMPTGRAAPREERSPRAAPREERSPRAAPREERSPRAAPREERNPRAAPREQHVQRPQQHGQRPQHQGQRPPQHQGQRSPQHQGQRSPQHQGPRPPQHQGQRSPQHQGPRSPQHQGPRPPQHQGQRSPQHQGQRPPQHQGGPARAEGGRPPAGPRRPRVPEVVVMTRRTRDRG